MIRRTAHGRAALARPLFAGAVVFAAWGTVHAEASGSALLKPAVGTIFWTLVTFVFMLVILGRYAWKPLLAALDSREQGIEGSLAEARRHREEAEALLKRHEQLMVEARRERAEAMEQGRQQAEGVKAEILEEARRQREQVLEQTRAQVEAEMRQARAELRASAVDLSIAAAGKLLGRNLDDSAQRRLVEEHLAEIERSGGPGAFPA